MNLSCKCIIFSVLMFLSAQLFGEERNVEKSLEQNPAEPSKPGEHSKPGKMQERQTPAVRMSSRDVREMRHGSVSLIPIALALIPSTDPLFGVGIRGDYYMDGTKTLGVIALRMEGRHDKKYTLVHQIDGQIRWHIRNAFYLMSGIGLRNIQQRKEWGYRDKASRSTQSAGETHFFANHLEVSGGVGNHWSWSRVNFGVQWVGITVPGSNMALEDHTKSSVTISDEKRGKRRREFRGDSMEWQVNLLQTAIGIVL